MRPARLAIILVATLALAARAQDPAPVRVLVWDEQQPAQKQAYPDFLGNAIAESLGREPGLVVRSSRLDDPGQGLADLDRTDVLIWWGHVRHREITPATGRAIVDRIKAGKLALVALHSAHWSTPFVEAMAERARIDAAAQLAKPEARGKFDKIEEIEPKLGVVPKRDEPRTPRLELDETTRTARLFLPSCVFPAYRGDGQPSHVRILKADHPLARGLPATFDIPQTEMYDEPFFVPEPDEALFEERWDKGESFRSGLVWKLGKGKVVYFRPGHETYPIFRQAEPLRILANAARWLGGDLPK